MELSMLSMNIESLGTSVTSSYSSDAIKAGEDFAKQISGNFIYPSEQDKHLNKVINDLYIVCHDTDILHQGKETFCRSVKNLASKATTLFLICCNGAADPNDGSNSIAQELAQWTNKDVWAATDVVSVESVCQGNPETSGVWRLCKPTSRRMDLE
jgi:hypothetical protein